MAETTPLCKQPYNIVLMYNFARNEGFPQCFKIGKCITDLYLWVEQCNTV